MSIWWPLTSTFMVCIIAWRGGATLSRLMIAALLTFVFGVAVAGYLADKLELPKEYSGPLCLVIVLLFVAEAICRRGRNNG